MAAYDLEEQEQLEELKTWWKQYGNMVTTIILVVSLLVAAWQGWGWWQRNASAEASAVYSQLQQAAGQRDAKRARELSGVLLDKYASTAYAPMGALIAAKVQVEAGDIKNARAQLEWVLAHAGDVGLRDIAKLRLASLLLDEGAHDDALKAIAGEPAAELKIRHAELMGDILVAQGKISEARTSYDLAVALVEKNEQSDESDIKRRATAYRELLRAKIDGLSTVVASVPVAPEAAAESSTKDAEKK